MSMGISRFMSHRFAFLLLIALLAVAGLLTQRISPKASASAVGKGPVVVELFTSEGCSSCPPADALLRTLEANASSNGTQVIVLGEHVDYWDRLGWKDRFSSADYTHRQQQYAEAFGTDQIYTPQMIVDGRAEFVGSDQVKARTAIGQASTQPKASVTLMIKHMSPQKIDLQTDISSLPSSSHKARVLVFVTETNLSSDVRAGENSGSTLQHAGVVRSIQPAGFVESSEIFHRAIPIILDKHWKLQDLQAIVVLQDERDRGIVGAASIPLK